MNKKTRFITEAAVIAAIYVVLVYAFQPISYGPVQFRIAEALTVLPYFTPAAVPGIGIGCFLSNLLTGADILDTIFGSLASLLAAYLSYKLRWNKFLVPLPPIIVNAIVVPFILKFAYFETNYSIPYMTLTVGAGQVLAAGVLGMVLLLALEKVRHVIFKND
mgnify:FL=1